jgi:microcystin-dependent protein
MCNGQLLAISQNTALFSILGTTYGGNGTSNFSLPDLRGRVPMHADTGQGFVQGEVSGTSTVTLLSTQMPGHVHQLVGDTSAASDSKPGAGVNGGGMVYGVADTNIYGGAANLTAMSNSAVGVSGNSQPHNNMQPYQVLNFIIALFGVFPSRS